MSDSEPESTSPPPSKPAHHHWMTELCLAVTTLTRLPLPCPAAADATPVGRAAWAFPLAGVVAGIFGAVIYAGATRLGLPLALAGIFAIAGMVWLTGGLHEDGLADCADGFGGGRTIESKLAIMRDSRLGTYGALSLIIVVLGRLYALIALDNPAWVGAALIAGAATSRAGIVALMVLMAPARRDGLAATAGQPNSRDLALAVAISLVVALALLGWRAGLYGFFGALIGAALVATAAQRQIGGQTGDVLGAAQQVAELGFLTFVLLADPLCLMCGEFN